MSKKLRATSVTRLDPAEVGEQGLRIRADVEALMPRWIEQGRETMAVTLALTNIALRVLGTAYGRNALLNFIEGLKESELVFDTPEHPQRPEQRKQGTH